MEKVRLELKNGEYRLVVVGSNRIVSRSRSKQECISFLGNQKKYGYVPTFEKGQHYAV